MSGEVSMEGQVSVAVVVGYLCWGWALLVAVQMLCNVILRVGTTSFTGIHKR